MLQETTIGVPSNVLSAPLNPMRLDRPTVAMLLSGAGMIVGLFGAPLGLPPLGVQISWGVSYIAGGWYGVTSALDSLRRFEVDIDLLMILAALGALSIGAPFEGAMLLFLFSLSNVLQDYAIGRSRQAIRALMGLRPETAMVRQDGVVQAVAIEQVAPGAVYVLKPGDRLPLDGVVVLGESEVNQASLTGESVPVIRTVGDPVFGGTINGSGALEVEVTRSADDSAIARMIRLVEDAQNEKAETQRILDRFEQPYALLVIAMTAVAVAIPVLWMGEAWDPAFYRAMTLMVAASPCALIISTPAAVLSAIAAGARNGVLFKGGVFVEVLATVRSVAFDKTGTLTAGETRLTDLVPAPGVDPTELLSLAAAVQSKSEHHLAAATVRRAHDEGLEIGDVVGFRASVGRGVAGSVGGRDIQIGNRRLLPADPSSHGSAEESGDFLGWEGGGAGGPHAHGESLSAAHDRLSAQARTVVTVAETIDGQTRPLGLLAFADTVRPEAAAVIVELRRQGVREVAMVTGDAKAVAEDVARQTGIDTVYAEVLPEGKVDLIREMRARHGTVLMVGDGVNDAPALAAATVGVAMGGVGTDVALETADLVLMSDDLGKLPWALELSRKARRTLIANLVFSVGVIVVMIGFILTVGLPLPLAVIGHEGSTVLVSLNGLRLLAFRQH